jgi:phosphate transport system substrate-binding protein
MNWRIVLIGTIWFWLGAQVQAQEIISGAGATFPGPFYGKLISEYHKLSKTRVDYQRVGSGAGVNMLLEQKVDFGASDIFLSNADIEQIQAPIVHIPTCIGAVAIITNLPGRPKLNLDSSLLAELLTGKIANWSDGRLNASNAMHDLPDLEVTVIHRSDSSGTTFILTDYLNKTNLRWSSLVGRGKKVTWPAGMGLQGNAGVSDMVSKVPGSIGYVSLNFALERSLAVAAIKNRSGRFIMPTQTSASLAADMPLPEDGRLLITDTAAPGGYPISAFTYILAYREQAYGHRSPAKKEALVHFLTWIANQGQQYAAALHYAPLPDEAVRCAMRAIGTITYNGRP